MALVLALALEIWPWPKVKAESLVGLQKTIASSTKVNRLETFELLELFWRSVTGQFYSFLRFISSLVSYVIKFCV